MRTFVFQTNPADYQAALDWSPGLYDVCDRPEAGSWTAPARAMPGDLFVLYGHKPIFEYGLVGRICSRPVLSVDGNHWAHVQMVACPQSLSLAEAKADPAIGRWPRFRMMAGAHLEITDSEVWDGFMSRLVDPFPEVRAVVRGWRAGARMPKLRERLDDAVRGNPNHNRSGTTHELAVQDQIWDAYLENGWGRDLQAADGVDIADSFRLPGAGFADIVLVDLESTRPTLLLIEVKRDAIPGETTDGVTQLLEYEPVLERLAPGWAIKKVLVALCFSTTVLHRARSAGIECWRYDVDDDKFLEP
jgi:hypothetical protein